MNIVERLRDYEYLVTDQSVRIEALESALREAREALNSMVKSSWLPQFARREYDSDEPEENVQRDFVQAAIAKINTVIGETK